MISNESLFFFFLSLFFVCVLLGWVYQEHSGWEMGFSADLREMLWCQHSQMTAGG